MKTTLLILALVLLGVSGASATPPYGGVSFGVFYSSLDPYGEWISVDAGLYAWRPLTIESGWRPYYYGRWLWTDYGWYWTSDEPWAWATYHYGRWYYDDYYGWLWIPGYDWAPAWVEWRYGSDCFGWAPLGPYAVFSINFGIFYRTHWVTPYYYWSFADYRYMCHQDLHRYVYRTDQNTRYIGRTRSGGSVSHEGGRIVSRGPDRQDIERRGNVRVEHTDIVPVSQRQTERYVRENDRGRIEVFRPAEERFTTDAERPSRVRESERSIGLDIGSLDVQSRARERQEGRDLRRAEQYRQQRQADIDRRGTERPADVAPQPRIERRNPEASPERSRREQVRPSPRPEGQVERQPAPRREPERLAPPNQEPKREQPRRESYQRPPEPPRRESVSRPAAPQTRPERGDGRRNR